MGLKSIIVRLPNGKELGVRCSIAVESSTVEDMLNAMVKYINYYSMGEHLDASHAIQDNPVIMGKLDGDTEDRFLEPQNTIAGELRFDPVIFSDNTEHLIAKITLYSSNKAEM